MTRSLPTPPPIFNGLILNSPLFILDVISLSLSLSSSHSHFPDGGEGAVVIVKNSAMIVVRGLDSSPSPPCLSRHLDPLPVPGFIHPYSLGAPDPPIQEMSADLTAVSNTSSIPPTTHSRPTLVILRHIQLDFGYRPRLVFLEISDPISTSSIQPLSNLSEIST